MSATALIHLRGKSWLIPGPTNIGVLESSHGAYLIDSGNDKEAGRKINRLLTEKNWPLLGILNTHSNADHIGANDYFQRMTQCKIFATQTEKAFIESPQIEASFLWGGFVPREMRTKFFEAKASQVTDILHEDTELLDGIKVLGLPGHYYQMVGFLTGDKVCYLGDALFGESILEKYKIPYIYDVGAYKTTIEKIKSIEAEYFVVSHGDIATSIAATADKNMDIVHTVEHLLLKLLQDQHTFEDIVRLLCTRMGIRLDIGQYALLGNTIRSFLSYLYNADSIAYEFRDNTLYWGAKQ